MGKEEPPFKFKIHLFLRSMNKDGRRDEQEGENSLPNIRELNCAVMSKLRQYNAQAVSDSVLRDKNGDADRIRYVFDIPER